MILKLPPSRLIAPPWWAKPPSNEHFLIDKFEKEFALINWPVISYF